MATLRFLKWLHILLTMAVPPDPEPIMITS